MKCLPCCSTHVKPCTWHLPPANSANRNKIRHYRSSLSCCWWSCLCFRWKRNISVHFCLFYKWLKTPHRSFKIFVSSFSVLDQLIVLFKLVFMLIFTFNVAEGVWRGVKELVTGSAEPAGSPVLCTWSSHCSVLARFPTRPILAVNWQIGHGILHHCHVSMNAARQKEGEPVRWHCCGNSLCKHSLIYWFTSKIIFPTLH